jgi:DNA-binding response OmpR family regulator
MQSDDTPPGEIVPPEEFRILIIDDDEVLCEMTAEYLVPLGFEVHCVHTGTSGTELALSEFWHAVILDLMLPDMSGFDVLRKIRNKSNVPVLMLTALGDSQNQIYGLELGADDYIPKSSPTRELLARLRSLLRRAGWTAQDAPVPSQQLIVLGELCINTSKHEASLGDKPLALTPTEYNFLLALVNAGGNTCTRDELSHISTGKPWQSFDRGVDMHIASLRKALRICEPAHDYIRTVRGVGYRICDPTQNL